MPLPHLLAQGLQVKESEIHPDSWIPRSIRLARLLEPEWDRLGDSTGAAVKSRQAPMLLLAP